MGFGHRVYKEGDPREISQRNEPKNHFRNWKK